jgi:hypothetical protein
MSKPKSFRDGVFCGKALINTRSLPFGSETLPNAKPETIPPPKKPPNPTSQLQHLTENRGGNLIHIPAVYTREPRIDYETANIPILLVCMHWGLQQFNGSTNQHHLAT